MKKLIFIYICTFFASNPLIVNHGFEVLKDSFSQDLYNSNFTSWDMDSAEKNKEVVEKENFEQNPPITSLCPALDLEEDPMNNENIDLKYQENENFVVFQKNISFKKIKVLNVVDVLIDTNVGSTLEKDNNRIQIDKEKRTDNILKRPSNRSLYGDVKNQKFKKKSLDVIYLNDLPKNSNSDFLISHPKNNEEKNISEFFSFPNIIRDNKNEFEARFKDLKRWSVFSGSTRDGLIYKIVPPYNKNMTIENKNTKDYKYGFKLNYLTHIKDFYLRKISFARDSKFKSDPDSFKIRDLTNQIEEFLQLKAYLTDVEIIEYLCGHEEERSLLENDLNKNVRNNKPLHSEIYQTFIKLQEKNILRFILPEYLAFQISKNFDFFKILSNKQTTESDYLALVFMYKLSILLKYIKNIYYESNNIFTVQRFLIFRFLFRELLLRNTKNIWNYSFYILYSNINLKELRTNIAYKYDMKLYLSDESNSCLYNFRTKKQLNIHSMAMRLLFVTSLENLLPKILYNYENQKNIKDLKNSCSIKNQSSLKIDNYHFYKIYLEQYNSTRFFFNYITRYKKQTKSFLTSIIKYAEILSKNPLYSAFASCSNEIQNLIADKIYKKGISRNKSQKGECFYKEEVDISINYLESMYEFEYKILSRHMFN